MSKYLKDRDGQDTMYLSDTSSATSNSTAFVYNNIQKDLPDFWQAIMLVNPDVVNWEIIWSWIHEDRYQRMAMVEFYSPEYYEDEVYDRFESKE